MSQVTIFNSGTPIPPGMAVQTIEGNTGGPVGPDGSNNIFFEGDGVSVTVDGNAGTNTLTISLLGGGLAIDEIDGDTGIPVVPTGAGLVNIIANTAALNAGSTVSFDGTANTLTLNVTNAGFNTIVGKNSGNATISGNDNAIFGPASGFSLTNGSGNVVLGGGSLGALTTGDYNTILGNGSADNYSGNESSNILIGYNVNGTNGENNTLVIGSGTGLGTGELTRAFICGIDGVDVGSVATVVTESGDQLGTAVITGGSGITVTPGANTITISGSGTIVYGYTNVNTTPYVVLADDDYLSVDSSGGAITVQLPDAATLGKTFVIKDRTGSAGANPITVTTVGGVVLIDGATSFGMNTNYEAISILGNNSSYEIF